jgi:hypothetical protein
MGKAPFHFIVISIPPFCRKVERERRTVFFRNSGETGKIPEKGLEHAGGVC